MRVIASFAAVATVAASVGALPPAAEAQTYLASAPGHFLYHGKSYCFSPGGWAGRGWYVCGFAQRRGYGYGGPHIFGTYGGFHRGYGWQHRYAWQHHGGWQHGFGFRHDGHGGFGHRGFGGVIRHPIGGHLTFGFHPHYSGFHHAGQAHGHPFRHHR